MPHTEYWTLQQEALDRHAARFRDDRKVPCGCGSDDIRRPPPFHREGETRTGKSAASSTKGDGAGGSGWPPSRRVDDRADLPT